MSRSNASLRTPSAAVSRSIVSLGVVALLAINAQFMTSRADDISLQADHGHILIGVLYKNSFDTTTTKRDRIVFRNFETGDTFGARLRTQYLAGVNKSVTLVSAPAGHYYFSYVASDRVASTLPFNKNTVSSDDIFEVRSGVVNYIGDWDLTGDLDRRRNRGKPEVSYKPATLQKSLVHFPEVLNVYAISVSMRGKKSTSLSELSEIRKQNADSAPE